MAKDLKTIEFQMNEDHIESMSEESYKKEIKLKVNKAAFKYLLAEQKEHNKIKDIKYDKLEVQPQFMQPIVQQKRTNYTLPSQVQINFRHKKRLQGNVF